MAIFSRIGLQGAFTIAHVIVAIMWMGLLWFFNFVQTPAYAEMEPSARNNAFDKLIGALSKQGVDMTRGFAVITSRCSFEMAQKAISAGIPVLAAVSAPTHLAIKLAESYDLTLLALARSDSMKLFAGSRRVQL